MGKPIRSDKGSVNKRVEKAEREGLSKDAQRRIACTESGAGAEAQLNIARALESK
jgi:hypothetical protein